MEIKQYDIVILKDGRRACIVEVLSDSVFIDIEAALSIAMNESPTIKIADMDIIVL